MTDHTRQPRCTAQLNGGTFCDAPALQDMPFPICHRHASQIWAAFNQTMRAELQRSRQRVSR
jgi:hypothetical protein